MLCTRNQGNEVVIHQVLKCYQKRRQLVQSYPKVRKVIEKLVKCYQTRTQLVKQIKKLMKYD